MEERELSLVELGYKLFEVKASDQEKKEFFKTALNLATNVLDGATSEENAEYLLDTVGKLLGEQAGINLKQEEQTE